MIERDIKRPLEFKELIESLRKGKDSKFEDAPFESYAEIMTFAASVGAKLCSEDFKYDYQHYGDPIKFKIFQHSGFDFIMYILAVYRDKDLNVLTSENEQRNKKIDIFEGYAYAGLKKLQSVVDRPGITIDNLVDFVKENIEEENTSEDFNLKEWISWNDKS